MNNYNPDIASKDWEALQRHIGAAESVFKIKLTRAITSTVSSHLVQVIYDRKTFSSAYEKCKYKNCSLADLTDLLRANVLISRKVNAHKIVDGIKKIFGKANVLKIDDRQEPRPGREYFGAIHIDVLVGEIKCEIQIMRKNLHSYVKETRKFYKTPQGERLKDMPDTAETIKQKNIERSLFERANRPQNIRHEEDYDMDTEASLISIVNKFYKLAHLI